MEGRYNPGQIEKKWQDTWEKQGVFRQYGREKKFYTLDMFPYPSGAGLHVGHPKGYIATDVLARTKQLQGYAVLHPMGWDAFGLPAEQYAIKTKTHPREATKKNVATFKNQLGRLGFTYDWDREINTTDPEYYKWTQWIFLQMFWKGLAYESYEPIIWCPSCQTGLANEDLENGACERCGTAVEKKPMRQWVLRITDYADRLLSGLDALDWPESIKESQRNWIGRSEGATVRFRIKNEESGMEEGIEVFTTRVDTLFGCTYVVVAPEHPLLKNQESGIKNEERTEFENQESGSRKQESGIKNWEEVRAYIEETKKKTEMERTAEGREKTGVRLEGITAINPINGEEVPVFVADYVLGDYGTGAVMAVPAHDERDFAFARQYGLPIKYVIHPTSFSYKKFEAGSQAIFQTIEDIFPEKDSETEGWLSETLMAEGKPYTSEGKLINSNAFTGIHSTDAREKITEKLETEGLGKKVVKYKLREWVFSRQRYWGEPIPVVRCEQCGVVPVPESELPVLLPDVESYEPTGTGESPLAAIDEWVNVVCPVCGGPAKRETNTMPQWAGSSWYYLRYIDPKNTEALVGKEQEKKWMPVGAYVGGAEHATRHLIYARFWHKFLFDIGAVSTDEPFRKLVNVGLILASDGRKMSKRWGNVVNPDDVVGEFGADAMRLYEMFMGPFSQMISWNTDGVVGTRRFLEKVWKLREKQSAVSSEQSTGSEKPRGIDSLLHKTIAKVTEDINAFRFNTAVSSLMELVNTFGKEEVVARAHYETFLVLLSPFAPHIAEELWEGLGNTESIFLSSWPVADPKLLVTDTVTIVVQVNGKVRDSFEISADATEDDLKAKALASEKVKPYLDGKEPKRVIVVPGKLVNVVT
ncbi:MAG TPA: leucine--tRNA ligase [Candidatus Fimivivens sp.]|nr:leucine--tRNA ligase [Candidatus Fimivivens sp.]